MSNNQDKIGESNKKHSNDCVVVSNTNNQKEKQRKINAKNREEYLQDFPHTD